MYQSPTRRRTTVRQDRNRRRHLSMVLGALIMAVLGALFMTISSQLAGDPDSSFLSSFTRFMGIAYLGLGTILMLITFIDIVQSNG